MTNFRSTKWMRIALLFASLLGMMTTSGCFQSMVKKQTLPPSTGYQSEIIQSDNSVGFPEGVDKLYIKDIKALYEERAYRLAVEKE